MKKILILLFVLVGLTGYSQHGPYRGIGVKSNTNDGVIELGGTFGKIDYIYSNQVSITSGYNYFDKHFESTVSVSAGMGIALGADINIKYKSNTEIYFRPKIGIGSPALYGLYYARDIRLSATGCSGDVLLLEINIPFMIDKNK